MKVQSWFPAARIRREATPLRITAALFVGTILVAGLAIEPARTLAITTAASSILVKFGLWHQITLLYHHESNGGVSFWFNSLSFASYSSWSLYGILQNDWVVVVAQTPGAIGAAIVITLMVRNFGFFAPKDLKGHHLHSLSCASCTVRSGGKWPRPCMWCAGVAHFVEKWSGVIESVCESCERTTLFHMIDEDMSDHWRFWLKHGDGDWEEVEPFEYYRFVFDRSLYAPTYWLNRQVNAYCEPTPGTGFAVEGIKGCVTSNSGAKLDLRVVL